MAKIPICSVKGCDEIARKLSKCWEHYNEYQAKSTKKWKDKVDEKVSTEGIGRYPVRYKGKYGSSTSNKKDKPLQRFKKRTAKQAAINDRLMQVRRELKIEWIENEKNYCIECVAVHGREVGWLTMNQACNYAHVIGKGECGSHEGLVLDPENQVPTCCRHHTKMDNGINEVRSDMKCYKELESIRAYLVKKYALKGFIRDGEG